MPELSTELLGDLPSNGPTDPIEYYRRPLVGYLFRERINMGLRLLGERRFRSVLEVGYGAGAVLVALAPTADELFGIDLDANPEVARSTLSRRSIEADLRRGSVCELPYEDARFNLVVSYSVFEHVPEYERALGEVCRVLRPGGCFLLGMPAVNGLMEWGFRAIGFRGIEDHHVTTPADVSRSFSRAGLRVVSDDRLGLRRVPGGTLYSVWLLERAKL